MAKTIFEVMGGTYVRQEGYNLPCLSLSAEKENKPIGVWDSGTCGIFVNINGCFTPLCSQAVS